MQKEYPAIQQDEQQKILHAKREWEQTFDSVTDLIFIVDRDHTIIRANHAMAARCGLATREVVGLKCYELMHAADAAPALCPHAELINCGTRRSVELTVESLGGTFEVTVSPLMNAEGRMTGTVHVARDVTEKNRQQMLLTAYQSQLEEINCALESRIETAVAELRKKDALLIQQSRLAAMSEMVSSIAHQWRQPLNNIGLIIQSLQLAFESNDLSAEELHADVAETMQELQHISQTIDDFRNFFSYEEVSSSFQINELVSHAITFVETSMKRKGIRIELDEEPDITVEGYPNEYMQAFLNILINARDALIEHQGKDPAVSIRIFKEHGRSVVTVRDNGGGIREEIMPKIFDPYFTTKKQITGAGIGLYMAKMIIDKKMHGDLTARNIDDGAEFRIEV